MNGMSSSNHTHKLVKSNCLLVDPCEGVLLRPLPGAHFEFIGKIDEFRPESEGGNPRISLAEASRRIGRERKTLDGWIEKSLLRREHGLKKINGRYLIDWPTFIGCLDRGEIVPCS
jgi:hypothetical protein